MHKKSSDQKLLTASCNKVIICNVYPEIDAGLFPIKRCINESVSVEADIFTDGHDDIAACLCVRHQDEADWEKINFEYLSNDRWVSQFTVRKTGLYFYTIQAWVDEFATWRNTITKKLNAVQVVTNELAFGTQRILSASKKAIESDRSQIINYAKKLKEEPHTEQLLKLLADKELINLINRYWPHTAISHYPHELQVTVDSTLANFSSWYELFPRSLANDVKSHASLKDLEAHLPYISNMGFDIVYLPPIHPIGATNRKGKNNNLHADENDPGSPWAIGDETGGHKAIHPKLGTLGDLKSLIHSAKKLRLEIALDFALQCSPNHPYLTEHPEWFKKRADGTLQYAENPPKKYEDIYPFDFDCKAWKPLWIEIKSIIDFWVSQGIKIFRVDNPHTKPFALWQWLISAVKKDHPDILFLAEAFTRPKLMYHLAKIGFTQSYTYFTWRNTKEELVSYFTELTSPPICDFFRPNLWPNTPDILHDYLQKGGKAAFITRFILAATLGTNYGIYGPAFELCINTPLKAGSEEYLHSEKYEIKAWDRHHPQTISHLIKKVNHIRRDHQALQNMQSLQFHPCDNPQLICYSKKSVNHMILVIVNLDAKHTQSGWVKFHPHLNNKMQLQPFEVHDLLTDEKYQWTGENYIVLNPDPINAHIFYISL